MTESMLTKEEISKIKRDLLFVPCKTREALHNWIKTYFHVDVPKYKVDPRSTTTPMDALWEIYSAALEDNRDDFKRVLVYASRDGGKTLISAILETLILVHMRRNVALMAAISSQAAKPIQYIRSFLSKPYLREFIIGDNDRKKEIVRYESSDGHVLSAKEYKELSEEDKNGYIEYRNYVVVIVCTMTGTNSEHVPFMCVDQDTTILVKNSDQSIRKNRLRVSRTARGLFRQLQGLNPGGRKPAGLEAPLDLPEVRHTEALTLNLTSGSFEFKRILRAHRDVRDTVEVSFEDPSNNIVCTPDHPVYVWGKGFVEASDIRPGDEVVGLNRGKTNVKQIKGTEASDLDLSYSEEEYDEWEQVIMGSLLGDAFAIKKPQNNAYLGENHCIEQAEYLEWKRSIVNNKVRTRSTTPTSGYKPDAEMVGYATGCSPLLNRFVQIRNDLTGFNNLSALGLAVWYMDDGCAGNSVVFSTEGWNEPQNHLLAAFLKRKFDIDVEPQNYQRENDKGELKTYWRLVGGIEAKRRLVSICEPHIHPTMAYKFDLERNHSTCDYCGQKYWYHQGGTRGGYNNPARLCTKRMCRMLHAGTVHKYKVIEVKDAGIRNVYDFTVEGNHNFFGNGLLNKNCIDEVDVVQNPLAYREAQMIPSPMGVTHPITMLTSTRKFSTGLVQQEIDNATKSGLQIRYWNILDVTYKCPERRHRPDLPMVDVYYNEDTLTTISPAEYDLLDTEHKKKHEPDRAFSGCVTNCKMFAYCRGNLATQQKVEEPVKGAKKQKATTFLKPVAHTQAQFQSLPLDTAKAQLLCWKPSAFGTVYPNLDASVHAKTATQIAEMITGEPQGQLDKAQLISLLKSKGIRFSTGLDFGWSHCFAGATAAVVGDRCFVLDAFAVPELEMGQQIELCDERLRHFDPKIAGDSEAPQNIATLRKAGFKIHGVKKGAGSVIGGIELVRFMLRPALGVPKVYFLADDEGVDQLLVTLKGYHWKTDVAGNPTKIPDETDDDLADAFRYLIMDNFSKNGRLTVSRDEPLKILGQEPTFQQPTASQWLTQEINKAIGGNYVQHTPTQTETGAPKGGKGRFNWSFGDD